MHFHEHETNMIKLKEEKNFVTVDKSKFMVGSYGPKIDVQTYATPFDDAPDGWLSRGNHVIKSKFGDDDEHCYLEWQWGLTIAKDW